MTNRIQIKDEFICCLKQRTTRKKNISLSRARETNKKRVNKCEEITFK